VLRDDGSHAIRTHDETGIDVDTPPRAIASDNTADTPVGVAPQRSDSHPVSNVGARGEGGVDQQTIEHRAARRVERVDTVRRLDRDDDLIAGVPEGCPPDGRRAGLDDGVEQSPAVQLDDGPSHQGVGREGVGAVSTAVDDEDALTGASEKHRGGGARGPGADDDDVVRA
jgi:hypothetical protein